MLHMPEPAADCDDTKKNAQFAHLHAPYTACNLLHLVWHPLVCFLGSTGYPPAALTY